MRVPPGSATEMSDDLHDTLLFAHEGACAVGDHELDGPGSLLVPAGEPRTLVAGPDGASLVCATLGAGTDLVENAGVPARLPGGAEDPGLILDPRGDVGRALPRFVAAIAKHRHHAREMDPPAV